MDMTNRREFIRSGMGAAAALAMPTAGFAAVKAITQEAVPASPPIDLEDLGRRIAIEALRALEEELSHTGLSVTSAQPRDEGVICICHRCDIDPTVDREMQLATIRLTAHELAMEVKHQAAVYRNLTGREPVVCMTSAEVHAWFMVHLQVKFCDLPLRDPVSLLKLLDPRTSSMEPA